MRARVKSSKFIDEECSFWVGELSKSGEMVDLCVVPVLGSCVAIG